MPAEAFFYEYVNLGVIPPEGVAREVFLYDYVNLGVTPPTTIVREARAYDYVNLGVDRPDVTERVVAQIGWGVPTVPGGIYSVIDVYADVFAYGYSNVTEAI